MQGFSNRFPFSPPSIQGGINAGSIGAHGAVPVSFGPIRGVSVGPAPGQPASANPVRARGVVGVRSTPFVPARPVGPEPGGGGVIHTQPVSSPISFRPILGSGPEPVQGRLYSY